MKYYLFGFMFFILVSCTKRDLSSPAYRLWVENAENGLKVRKEIADFGFTLFYKPHEYIALAEHEKLSAEQLKDRLKELEGYQYYTLKIETKKHDELMKAAATSELEYYQHLEYFISGMQNDISLIDGADTLPCVMYHFEQNYHLAPFNNILLAFKKNPDQAVTGTTDKTLLYNDHLLGTGTVRMTIKGSAIDNTPKLKL